jgi:HEAT repeat protein
MARHLVRSLCYAAIGAALSLQGCGKPTLSSSDREVRAAAGRAAAADAPVEPRRSSENSKTLPVASSQIEQRQSDDPPPWLDELLHAPDPNVRIQALDAWARQPTASLDPVTYALVDPDESVRARAQEWLERELVRR